MEAAMEAITEAFTFAAVIGVLAVSEDKDVAGILDQMEPGISELVVTRDSSDRSMDPDKLGELAASAFGAERVHVARRLDDALEMAVGLAAGASGEVGRALTGGHSSPGAAGAAGGVLAVAAVLLAAVVGRPGLRVALVAGSVLQVLVIAAGVMVPVMYVLGVIFAGFWVLAIWMGRRAEASGAAPARSAGSRRSPRTRSRPCRRPGGPG